MQKIQGGGNSLKLGVGSCELGVKSEEVRVGGGSSSGRFGGLLAFLFSVAFSFDAAAFSVCAVGDSITQGVETTCDIVIYGSSPAAISAAVQDGRIVSIKTLSGNVYRGKVFIDATYEGDLMAAAGEEMSSSMSPGGGFIIKFSK